MGRRQGGEGGREGGGREVRMEGGREAGGRESWIGHGEEEGEEEGCKRLGYQKEDGRSSNSRNHSQGSQKVKVGLN